MAADPATLLGVGIAQEATGGEMTPEAEFLSLLDWKYFNIYPNSQIYMKAGHINAVFKRIHITSQTVVRILVQVLIFLHKFIADSQKRGTI